MRAAVATCLVLVAAFAAGVAPAAAAAPKVTAVLQYSKQAGPVGGAGVPSRLVARLRGLGLSPARFEVLPMLVVRGTRAQVRQAGALQGVLYRHTGNPRIVYDLSRSVPLVFRGPPAPVRAAAGDAKGVRVAVLDTGVDGTHPHIGPRVVHAVDFVTTEGPNRITAGDVPLAHVPVVCPSPCNNDVDGHGTHVAGIVAGMGRGSGEHAGMAPEAEIVNLSIGHAGAAIQALAAIDYILAHPELRVRVVNNSWHYAVNGFDPTEPINQATKMLHDAGITVVFSAGNSGQGTPAEGQPRGSSNCIDGPSSDCAISLQGSAPWTVMVAAGDAVGPGGPEEQHLYDASSRGDPRPARIGGVDVTFMPTLTAPGSQIVSTAGGALAIRCVGVPCHDGKTDALYAEMGGTSMAVPHVSGAIALLQSAARIKLGRELTPDEVKALLVQGAAPMTRLFDERDDCDPYLAPVSGCNPTTCADVAAALGCEPTNPTGHYQRWQVGAGYLDIPGTLRALDRLAVRPAEQPPAPPAPAAVTPAPPQSAPAAATGGVVRAATKTKKKSKRKSRKRKASKRRKTRSSKKRSSNKARRPIRRRR